MKCKRLKLVNPMKACKLYKCLIGKIEWNLQIETPLKYLIHSWAARRMQSHWQSSGRPQGQVEMHLGALQRRFQQAVEFID